jgi:hypothetical protein
MGGSPRKFTPSIQLFVVIPGLCRFVRFYPNLRYKKFVQFVSRILLPYSQSDVLPFKHSPIDSHIKIVYLQVEKESDENKNSQFIISGRYAR